MKDCSKYTEMMSLYLDGMLSGKQLEAFNRHIALCESCKEELEALQSLVSCLNDLPEVDLPEEFHERAMAKLKVNVNVNHQGKEKRKPMNLLEGFGLRNFVPVAASVLACFIILGGALNAMSGILPENRRYLSITGEPDASGMQEVAPEMGPVRSGPVLGQSPEAPYSMSQAPQESPEESASDDGLAGGPAYGSPTAAYDAGLAAAKENLDEESSDGHMVAVEEAQFQSGEADIPEMLSGRASVLENESVQNQASMDSPILESQADSVTSNHAGVLTKAYHIRLESPDINGAAAAIRAAGWDIESSGVSSDRAQFTLKIPAGEYEYAIGAVKAMGHVFNEWEQVQDMTFETNDLAGKYHAKTEEAARIYDLIYKAETADDIIMLQERLTNITNAQETYKGKYRGNLALGSGYSINVEIVAEEIYEAEREKGFGEKVNTAFTSSVNGTARFFEGSMVFLSAIFLPAVVIGGAAALGWVVWKSLSKRRRP